MKIFVPKETAVGETRVPVIPDSVKKLVGLGAEVEVESGIG
ncbi:MAG: NAD(P)(+) transhydrogenase (Re/Si-specific) subunit alpha, partial [Verrucomicrobia bacterium]|nr:NAD(P)(+) transhydrogenase (Re/Si-specific) subunit alpha [Verrucomicrobiota bacterium]